ncbi:MAG: GspE/PulE family protein [Candidatus Omnitrophota bacterium]
MESGKPGKDNMQGSLRDRIIGAIQESGLVNQKRLEEVIEEAHGKNEGDVINMLAESGAITDRNFLMVMSRELDIPPIDISRVALDKKILALIPEKLAERHSVLALARTGNHITLVVSDPTDVFAIDDVKAVTGCDVQLVLSMRREIQKALKSVYGEEEEKTLSEIIDESDVSVIEEGAALDVTELTEESKTAPIVKMVDAMISEALAKRASDIHVEPQEKSLRVRYRVDGKLYTVFDLPKKSQNAILARLKIMSNLDITENRVPQDGRFRVSLVDREVDFRVSVLPAIFGSKIVLRALDRKNLSVGFESLGFSPGPMKDFKEALSRPFGIILVTGPTGSGKSTTLYSILNEMNVPERNIVTVEDPVEYQVAGITQIAARQDIGLDFAGGLRALLRQSPDVIMVGEIRDFETADIAIKASLTGQMVLSTLHTNDAVGAITRLVNMGIEPFLIASSLVMSCAQRLLRRICPSCKEETRIQEEMMKKIREEYPEAADVDKFYKGKGCEKCNGTGYLGRLGTLETVLIDDAIREMINKRRPEDEIKAYLRRKGVTTLRDNAMMKFFKGWTTLEEVLRAT